MSETSDKKDGELPDILMPEPLERLVGLDGKFIEKAFNWPRLDATLSLGCSISEAVGIMEISRETIVRKIRDRYDMTFEEYKDVRMARRKMSLRQRMWRAAEEGNVTAMIWLSKNELGMTDKFSAEISETQNHVIKFAYSIPGNKFAPKEKPDIEIKKDE